MQQLVVRTFSDDEYQPPSCSPCDADDRHSPQQNTTRICYYTSYRQYRLYLNHFCTNTHFKYSFLHEHYIEKAAKGGNNVK